MVKLLEKVIELANSRHIDVEEKFSNAANLIAYTVISFVGVLFFGPMGLAVGILFVGLTAYVISHWAKSN